MTMIYHFTAALAFVLEIKKKKKNGGKNPGANIVFESRHLGAGLVFSNLAFSG
jgi:hypothetical protein